MANKAAMIISAGLGAGFMYLFDPDRGRRRRALARDQMVRVTRKATDALDTTSKDVMNRSRGLRANLRSWLYAEREATDEVIGKRVRAAIGRSITHPGSIEVLVRDGRVTLAGPILAHEVTPLLRQVWRVRGVTDVENQLEAHTEPGNIPGLQGEPGIRSGSRISFMQSNWSPTTRLVAGALGGIAAGYGLSRRSPLSLLLGASGALLFARAASNVEVARLTGIRAGRRGVDIQKTMHFNAPVERVFELWSKFENFPQFMAHVREVKKTAEGQWHWSVTGPMGSPVEFDAEISAIEPNRVIAWRTREDSPIRHAGIVHFEPQADGTTVADIKFTYNPIAGAVGHAIARIFGSDPKRQMDEDLMRMKTYLETGRPPHDAAASALHH